GTSSAATRDGAADHRAMSNAAAPVAASDVIEEETQRDPDIALRKLLGRGDARVSDIFLTCGLRIGDP
ncbi:MAG TPA: hypothetical protein VFZ14_01140, partial [Burkholderiales bacterium]|nr:hypothetical protein [Burkholderiales bacterium]